MGGRTALITGGTGGLGGVVTEAFVDAGWRVVVPVLPELAGTAASPAELVSADLTDAEDVARVVKTAAADADAPLRALVNLVGGFAAGGRVHETPLADFESQFALNLRPTYLVTAAAVPHLIANGGGAVVCVGTRAAEQPFAGAAGYVTSKAAVLAFTECVAVEYKNDGIRANAILPSVIDTPANRAANPDADYSRWVSPAEIAAAIRYLCSDDARSISGTRVRIYGRA